MKWLHEPVVHFLALGVGLFLLFSWVGEEGEAGDRIVVTQAQIALLVEGYERTWERSPTTEELRSLVEDHVRDEIYYREALAMGLDRDDTIIRRRMRQKLEVMTEGMTEAIEPTDEELETYFEDHAEAFRAPPTLSFEQIFYDSDERGARALAEAQSLLARLRSDPSLPEREELGDPPPVPRRFDDVTNREVARQLGQGFADRLEPLPTGEWSGPVRSGYGQHLILVRNRREGDIPQLDQVRGAVNRQWQDSLQEQVEESFFQSLRDRYSVEIEGTLDGAAGLSGREAPDGESNSEAEADLTGSAG